MTEKDGKKKQESTVAVISTKHSLCDRNMVGRDEGLSKRHICHLPLLYFSEKNFFDLIECIWIV